MKRHVLFGENQRIRFEVYAVGASEDNETKRNIETHRKGKGTLQKSFRRKKSEKKVRKKDQIYKKYRKHHI